MKPLSIALPAGKLLGPAMDFLARSGIICDTLSMDERHKIYFDNKHKYKLILLEPFDIPVYVELGAADLGIVTRDILLERDRTVLELLELNYGHGKLILATLEGNNVRTIADIYTSSSVATNYPFIAHNYFRSLGIPVEIIEVSPPVELALECGLSDLILTYSPAERLCEDIIEIAEIARVSNLIIANRISFKNSFNKIYYLIQRMKELIVSPCADALSFP
ncbi:MAG: ATP phosphoribosyltransferase [Candidatus Eremiobacterota bacterium]